MSRAVATTHGIFPFKLSLPGDASGRIPERLGLVLSENIFPAALRRCHGNREQAERLSERAAAEGLNRTRACSMYFDTTHYESLLLEDACRRLTADARARAAYDAAPAIEEALPEAPWWRDLRFLQVLRERCFVYVVLHEAVCGRAGGTDLDLAALIRSDRQRKSSFLSQYRTALSELGRQLSTALDALERDERAGSDPVEKWLAELGAHCEALAATRAGYAPTGLLSWIGAHPYTAGYSLEYALLSAQFAELSALLAPRNGTAVAQLEGAFTELTACVTGTAPGGTAALVAHLDARPRRHKFEDAPRTVIDRIANAAPKPVPAVEPQPDPTRPPYRWDVLSLVAAQFHADCPEREVLSGVVFGDEPAVIARHLRDVYPDLSAIAPDLLGAARAVLRDWSEFLTNDRLRSRRHCTSWGLCEIPAAARSDPHAIADALVVLSTWCDDPPVATTGARWAPAGEVGEVLLAAVCAACLDRLSVALGNVGRCINRAGANPPVPVVEQILGATWRDSDTWARPHAVTARLDEVFHGFDAATR